MHIQNITFCVQNTAFDRWKKWYHQSFLPKCTNSDYCTQVSPFAIASEDAQESSFAVHIHLKDTSAFEEFDREFLPVVKQELFLAFGCNVLFFTTRLTQAIL